MGSSEFNAGEVTLLIIRQVISNNLGILRSSQRFLEAFSSPPRISYRRCKNLRDTLVRVKHRRQPFKELLFLLGCILDFHQLCDQN